MKRDLAAMLERMEADREFADLVQNEPEKAALAMGWTPEVLASYEIDETAAARNCGSACGCDSGTGQGCAEEPGRGTHCPSGQPGGTHECPHRIS